MNIWEYLHEKNERERMEEQRKRVYFDIGHILWFLVLYDNVLSHKRTKMEEQNAPFMINCWGDMFLEYGPCKALTSREDIEKFERVAEAELRDRGFLGLKVKAYNNCILVRGQRQYKR